MDLTKKIQVVNTLTLNVELNAQSRHSVWIIICIYL